MATLLPSRLSGTFGSAMNEQRLVEALHPWQRQLTLQQGIRWLVRGIITGLFLAALLLLIARIIPWEHAPLWAALVGAACVVLMVAGALWSRPSLAGTARQVDRRLALEDRLSTAWELRQEASPLSVLQRRDALDQVQRARPSQAISLRPRGSTLLVAAFLALVVALLLLLPNPLIAALKQQAAFQARVARQVASIEQVRQEVVQQQDVPAAQKAQIDRILRDLETQLQQAKNETEAQQAIAKAQAQLDQLRNPSVANNAQARSAAGSSLASSSNSMLKSVGQALSKGDPKALEKALQQLSSQASALSQAQRSQLAQQVEAAANQAGQDPNLSSSLHQLAKSLADSSQNAQSDQSDLANAAKAVNAAASQDAAAQAQENAVNQAAQSLQQTANNLANASDTAVSQQNQGQNQQAGQGQGQQAEQAQAQGQGQQQAQGQGQGQSQSQGQGDGQGRGNGGSSVSGKGQGKNEQVYVPGQVGSGSSTQTNGGNNGPAQSGDSVPYSQVIQAYNQMAHDAIDNSAVSPDMKDLVHDYFDSLEGH